MDYSLASKKILTLEQMFDIIRSTIGGYIMDKDKELNDCRDNIKKLIDNIEDIQFLKYLSELIKLIWRKVAEY